MTNKRVIHKTSLATADLERQAEYYRRQAGLGLALRFVDGAQSALEKLVAMPKIGPILGLDELPYEDIRRWHVDGFDRIMILYRETADGIEVIRVLHSARDVAVVLRDSALAD